ncbi:LysR substrate-binding domain-containing protein [Oceanospirillum beijerinckii]|uniref:LysR substrate-binding domain-containing protein n=1 Tax=Oceanospirillum beijerinckii TaxID=64976 RepID=UPI00040229BB|nr:LysR substrate-binding domain-containing protein [Oceanospirillum beijerinckii]
MIKAPPLKAIQYFCVAAQHLSFKEAANQLSVTPGAVSQQVRVLEAWLGGRLFERATRSITLTTLGQTYFNRVNPLMQETIGVTHSVQQLTYSRTLKLATTQSFAARWLGAHLKEFLQQDSDQIGAGDFGKQAVGKKDLDGIDAEKKVASPSQQPSTQNQRKMDLRIVSSSHIEDLADDGSELAIRYLPQPDPTLSCHRLKELELRPVCSPEYLERFPGVLHGDLTGCTLVHDILHPDWHRFYPLFKMDHRLLSALHFDHAQLALDAAERSLGIALADQLLAEQSLDSGHLISFSRFMIPAHRHLYLVHSNRVPLSEPAERIKRWLMQTLSS